MDRIAELEALLLVTTNESEINLIILHIQHLELSQGDLPY